MPGPCGSAAAAAHSGVCDGFGVGNSFSFLIVLYENQLSFLILQWILEIPASRVFFSANSQLLRTNLVGAPIMPSILCFPMLLKSNEGRD